MITLGVNVAPETGIERTVCAVRAGGRDDVIHPMKCFCRSWARVVAAFALAAVAVGCTTPPPAKEAVAKPPITLSQWIRSEGDAELRKFQVLEEFREGVAPSLSEPLRLPCEKIAPGQKLEFAFAISSGDLAHRNKAFYSFAVYWRDADGEMRLLSERTTRTDTRWFDVSVPLDDLASASGEFSFIITDNDRAPSRDDRTPSIPVWGDARIVPATEPTRDDRPNFLWITIDTVRADHVGAYGYERDTTPFIDSLAERGVLFTAAYSHAPWTLPSTWAMMRSRYFDETDPSRRDFLPEVLRANGYNTIGWIGNTAVPGYGIGLTRYFEVMDETVPERFRTWLPSRDPKPFFAYIHLLGAHLPYSYRNGISDAFIDADDQAKMANTYRPDLFHKPSDADLDRLVRLYDGEILAADRIVEELTETLELMGLRENTYIIVTSDHGEEFWEHGGFEHGHTFFDDQLHVPLVIVPPGSKTPKRIATSVGLIRVAPTLLKAAGISPPESYYGRPLDLNEEKGTDDSVYFADLLFPDLYYNAVRAGLPSGTTLADPDPAVFGIRSPAMKSIMNHRGEVVQLFDLRADPGERTNLLADPKALEESKTMWERFRQRMNSVSKSCGTFHIRLASEAPAKWTVEMESDRRVLPVLTSEEMRRTRWKREPDGRRGTFIMTTDAGDPFTLKVKQMCEAEGVSLRIIKDGVPLADDHVRLRNDAGGLAVRELTSNLVTEKARSVLLVPPESETPLAGGTWAELWLTEDPVPRINRRLPTRDEEREAALRSLGYLQ